MKTSKKSFFLALMLIFALTGFSQTQKASEETVVLPKFIVKEDRFWESWLNMDARPTEWKGREVISGVRITKLDRSNPLYAAGLRNGQRVWKIQGVVPSGHTPEDFNKLVLQGLIQPNVTHFKVEIYERHKGGLFTTYSVPLKDIVAFSRGFNRGKQIAQAP